MTENNTIHSEPHGAKEEEMAKFRMKPVEKEAFRWTGGPDQVEYPAWLQDAMGEGYVYFRNSGTA